MGNLIVEKDGLGSYRLRLYKSKPSVMMRVPRPHTLSEEVQQAIFKFLTPWQRSGFEFAFHKRDLMTSASEMLQERRALETKLLTGRPTPYGEATVQQEHHLYIDFTEAVHDESLAGGGHQRNWQSSFQKCASSRISIDPSRGFIQEDVLHEVGHALGLDHEHQRSDRDTYVMPRDEAQYNDFFEEGQQVGMHLTEDLSQLESVPFGPYDYDSVMHYPDIFIRIQDRGNTGGTVSLSEGDLRTARFLYNETRIHEYLNSGSATPAKQAQKEMQQNRQRMLMPPYVRAEGVIKRTYDVVENQLAQLTSIRLPIEAQDQALQNWAHFHYQRIQRRAGASAMLFQEPPAREQAHRTHVRPVRCCS